MPSSKQHTVPEEESPEMLWTRRMEAEMMRGESRDMLPAANDDMEAEMMRDDSRDMPPAANDDMEEAHQEDELASAQRREPMVEMNINGTWRAHLVAGDSVPEVLPINIQTYIDSANSRLTEIGKRKVEAADLGNPDANEEIQAELEEAHATRELAETLGAVFRTCGPDVWMVKQGAIDEYKLGNRLDFSGARMEFVVPESKGDEMKAKLDHLGAATGAVVGGAFEYKKEFARLDTKDGFTVNYRYTNAQGKQQTTEIVFLYCKERVLDEDDTAAAA